MIKILFSNNKLLKGMCCRINMVWRLKSAIPTAWTKLSLVTPHSPKRRLKRIITLKASTVPPHHLHFGVGSEKENESGSLLEFETARSANSLPFYDQYPKHQLPSQHSAVQEGIQRVTACHRFCTRMTLRIQWSTLLGLDWSRWLRNILSGTWCSQLNRISLVELCKNSLHHGRLRTTSISIFLKYLFIPL